MHRTACRVLAQFLAAALWLTAAEFHVSPAGTPGGDGSAARPWDLATALSGAGPVRPGDTLWLRGGTYRGGFESRLNGTAERRVTVRQYPGERAILDADGAKTAAIQVFGQWTTFRDFEITDSNPDRTRERPHGLFVRGPHTNVLNLVIHDCGVGIGFWSDCTGPAEIYGCIIYNNGWQGPGNDRGHGHAIYTQNQEGTKRLVDNVMFNQFGFGIHAYGSSRAFLRGFHIEGNAAFNNGALTRDRVMSNNILVGGGSPAERITVIGNFTYTDKPSVSFRLGYGARNKDLVARDNYIVGSSFVQLWENIVFTGNTLISPSWLLRLQVPEDGSPAGYAWDKNTALAAGDAPFQLVRGADTTGLGVSEWVGKTGLDANSSIRSQGPSGVKVVVRPNQHEKGRAHIIVYNWDRKDSVPVDAGGLMKRGAAYELRDAQDYLGAPVLAGVYDGKPLRVPMSVREPAPPVGATGSKPLTTSPVFGVFVLRSK
jgi:hypothetical protein